MQCVSVCAARRSTQSPAAAHQSWAKGQGQEDAQVCWPKQMLQSQCVQEAVSAVELR